MSDAVARRVECLAAAQLDPFEARTQPPILGRRNRRQNSASYEILV